MRNLDIVGFIPKSTTDWRGKLCSVIFVPGCNFSCGYCFSHQLILHPASLPKIPEAEIFTFLSEKQNNIQAVLVTGGEPTLHGSRLMQFLEQAQNIGLLTRIETNGSNPFMIRTLVENDLVDSVVLDIKAPLYPDRYLQATGKTAVLSKIKRSIFFVMKSGIDYEFRTVMIPEKTTLRDIQSIARSIRGAKRFVLQQFTPFSGTLDKSFESVAPTSYEELIQTAQRLRGIQEVRIRTDKGEETVQGVSQLEQPNRLGSATPKK